jgi:hypothetical protein
MLSYQYASAAADECLLRVNQAISRGPKSGPSKPGSPEPVTSKPGTFEPGTFEPATSEPAASDGATAKPRVAARRARRQLARAAARIERSGAYQRSLSELAELASTFRAELEPPQRERWLALEDAVLEHVAKLNRSYFYAGVAWGEASGRSPRSAEPRPAASRPAASRPAASEHPSQGQTPSQFHPAEHTAGAAAPRRSRARRERELVLTLAAAITQLLRR